MRCSGSRELIDGVINVGDAAGHLKRNNPSRDSSDSSGNTAFVSSCEKLLESPRCSRQGSDKRSESTETTWATVRVRRRVSALDNTNSSRHAVRESTPAPHEQSGQETSQFAISTPYGRE